ncbi:hypothetical protein EDB89DRAFT_595012 [Lactarius sanguifluus]|nr:hypothetical protein EDB89DRAFT_595012 [Lactarius sanguifluus]
MPPPVHIHCVRRLLLMGGTSLFSCVHGLFWSVFAVPDYLGYVIISSWEVLFLYAIGSDCQHCPCAGTLLLFLYAIGSGFAFARARENIIRLRDNAHEMSVFVCYRPLLLGCEGYFLLLLSFYIAAYASTLGVSLRVFSVSNRDSDPAVLFDRDRLLLLPARHLRQRQDFVSSAAASSSAAITGV